MQKDVDVRIAVAGTGYVGLSIDTLDGESAYANADFVVIAAPTNYDPVKNFFDTHHIEDIIDIVPTAMMPASTT